MVEDNIKDVVSQFSKPEIISIAEELQVDATGKSSIVLIEELIIKIKHLLEEEDVELSDLAYEFAETAEVIDEEGNALESEKPKEVVKDVIPANAPECYIYAAANPADPSCKKCRVLVECQARRILRRPKCFGNPKLYNSKDVECERCLENIDGFCSAEATKGV
jgi:hypothetical protein